MQPFTIYKYLEGRYHTARSPRAQTFTRDACVSLTREEFFWEGWTDYTWVPIDTQPQAQTTSQAENHLPTTEEQVRECVPVCVYLGNTLAASQSATGRPYLLILSLK